MTLGIESNDSRGGRLVMESGWNLIVGSVPVQQDQLSFYRQWVDKAKCLFCADGGAKLFRSLNHPPDYLVGDMDSISFDDFQWMLNHKVRTLVLPVSKDSLDSELCIHIAKKNKAWRIAFLCLWGDRPDHSLATLNLISLAQDLGIEATVQDPQWEMGILNGPISKRFVTSPGTRWSLISISDQCKEVTLRGMKYPLDSELLDRRHPRGVSNQAEKNEVLIRFSSGSMVYFHWRSQEKKGNLKKDND